MQRTKRMNLPNPLMSSSCGTGAATRVSFRNSGPGERDDVPPLCARDHLDADDEVHAAEDTLDGARLDIEGRDGYVVDPQQPYGREHSVEHQLVNDVRVRLALVQALLHAPMVIGLRCSGLTQISSFRNYRPRRAAQ